MDTPLSPLLRRSSAISLLLLIALCVAWEAWFAPVRPGGSWLILKALPLAFAVRKVARGDLYTYQWSAMLVLLYIAEGVVRAMSDTSQASVVLACGEIVLGTVFFLSALLYVRPAKRAARRARRDDQGVSS